MSFGSVQRYVNDEFICVKCHKTNKTRIDTLTDLYYKGKNPPIQAGHRQPYYERNCEYCGAYNEILWKEDSRH